MLYYLINNTVNLQSCIFTCVLMKMHFLAQSAIYRSTCLFFTVFRQIECFSTISKELIISLPFVLTSHLDEGQKNFRVLPIPLHDSKGSICHYDHMSISPDGKVLAPTSGSAL